MNDKQAVPNLRVHITNLDKNKKCPNIFHILLAKMKRQTQTSRHCISLMGSKNDGMSTGTGSEGASRGTIFSNGYGTVCRLEKHYQNNKKDSHGVPLQGNKSENRLCETILIWTWSARVIGNLHRLAGDTYIL